MRWSDKRLACLECSSCAAKLFSKRGEACTLHQLLIHRAVDAKVWQGRKFNNLPTFLLHSFNHSLLSTKLHSVTLQILKCLRIVVGGITRGETLGRRFVCQISTHILHTSNVTAFSTQQMNKECSFDLAFKSGAIK